MVDKLNFCVHERHVTVSKDPWIFGKGVYQAHDKIVAYQKKKKKKFILTFQGETWPSFDKFFILLLISLCVIERNFKFM